MMVAWYLAVSMLVKGTSEDAITCQIMCCCSAQNICMTQSRSRALLGPEQNKFLGPWLNTLPTSALQLYVLDARFSWEQTQPADPFCSITSEPLIEDKKKISSHQSQSARSSNDPLGCLWITNTTTLTSYVHKKQRSGTSPTRIIWPGEHRLHFFFFFLSDNKVSVLRLISPLISFPNLPHLPPSAVRHESSHYSTIISNRLSPCVWLALHPSSSRVCVRERHLIISQSYGSVPLIRLEARGKRSKLLFFWTRSSFFFPSPPQWTRAVADAFTLWAKRANSSIYMYVCKTSFHSAIKTKQMKLSCFVNLSLLLRPKNPQIDVDLNLCAVVMHHRTFGNDKTTASW